VRNIKWMNAARHSAASRKLPSVPYMSGCAGARRALMGLEGPLRRRQMVVAKGVYMRLRTERDVLPTQARVIMVRYTRCE
jgi:hypothetical protein